MGTASERNFVVFQRGAVRDDVILANFRADLRTTVNPATGLVFTEDEVQRATQPGSRFYVEADSIDLFGQAQQQRALAFVSQIDPRKANTEFLNRFHGRIWLGPNSRLPAVGASGPVLATGTAGTIIPGSPVLGAPTAAIATDPNGLRYQNLTPATIGGDGQAPVTLQGIDVGAQTRLTPGTVLTWSANVNPGTDPTAAVAAAFDGGFDEETDEEYAARIAERIRSRPASGNAAHFQAWATEASVAVEQAFVYPVALNAGTVLVAVTEKRAPILQASQVPEGPNARVPSVGTLQTLASYLTPPGSAVVPQQVAVYLTGVVPQPSDAVVRITMAEGRAGGWADVIPWPSYSQAVPATQVKTVSPDGLTLTVESNQQLPNGAAVLAGPDAPKVMLWDLNVSRFVQLDVESVTDPNPGTTTVRDFTIVLSSEPTMYQPDGSERATPVVQAGDRLSPFTDRNGIIADAMEGYFDSLGPGEVVSPTATRASRARRQPAPEVSFPNRAGQAMVSDIIAALGGTAGDAELTSITEQDPDLPSNVIEGPSIITLGHCNAFPL